MPAPVSAVAKSRAARLRSRCEKCSTQKTSGPPRSSNRQRSRNVVSRAGGSAREKNSRGSGSKLIIMLCQPADRARAYRAVDQHAMAAMQAIEAADGRHVTGVAVWQGLEAALQAHQCGTDLRSR